MQAFLMVILFIFKLLATMNSFTIEKNNFLKQEIKGFYHTNFYGVTHPDNPNYLYKFKNDIHHNWTDSQLNYACGELRNVLLADLPQILQSLQLKTLTVCIVPRAKAGNSYRANQLLFKATVKSVVDQLNDFEDGTNYISRHTNTKTTHLRKPVEGFVNDGSLPYVGITSKTCNISNNVSGKDILLIDDIYTKTVNIDEDAIQVLLDNGARLVAFYAVGNTVSRF